MSAAAGMSDAEVVQRAGQVLGRLSTIVFDGAEWGLTVDERLRRVEQILTDAGLGRRPDSPT